jgi:N6-L-threonylcarbamoyladenine synthase
MLDSRDHNFSFSGLKTAVRYLLPKIGLRAAPAVIPSESEGSRENRSDVREVLRSAQDDRVVNDICASFQQAVIDVLVQKTLRAAHEVCTTMVTLSGGVSCNRELRESMRRGCEEANLKFLGAKSELCTDNAAMIAFAASLRLRNGFTSKVEDEIDPNLALIVSG